MPVIIQTAAPCAIEGGDYLLSKLVIGLILVSSLEVGSRHSDPPLHQGARHAVGIEGLFQLSYLISDSYHTTFTTILSVLLLMYKETYKINDDDKKKIDTKKKEEQKK